MSRFLHLTISTPFAVLADEAEVVALRAQDASGSFGVLPGHVDLLTVLNASVVRWRNGGGKTRYCALRGGVLTVSGGSAVAIACRDGLIGDDIVKLADDVRALRAEQLDAEHRARTEQMRMHARAVRQIVGFLNPGGTAGAAFKDGAP